MCMQKELAKGARGDSVRELRDGDKTVCCNVLQYIAVCCSVLRCVAVCCTVLQYIAVWCNVL